ncbi:MAG: hypothetical protein K2Z81_28855, partial [Cyanobacteria bacterium]|nr:hypothetical protein [Cyanobacteriota bacterium]
GQLRSLSDNDLAMCRRVLASYVTKHGAPGSEKLLETRRLQHTDAGRPLHHKVAKVLSDRLNDLSDDDGVPDLQSYLTPLSEEETASIGASTGGPIPHSLARKAMRCWEAPLSVLLENEVLQSSEAMAAVLPLLTAHIRISSIANPELARVFDHVYRSFRRRRSLLLLNYEKQVRFEELPWISAIDPFTGAGSSRESAKAALTLAACGAIRSFPQTITPNKLVTELRALAKAAELSMPLVEELASDIFMGSFTVHFLNAAKEAAVLLKGSLYERYYGVNFGNVLTLRETRKVIGPAIAETFSRLCVERAGPQTGRRVAWNGMVIEQAQILTTHNLASLFNGLGLKDSIGPSDLQDAARYCFAWVCRRLQIKTAVWRIRLQFIKNSAFAWRQMLFYLSLLDKDGLDSFLEWGVQFFSSQPEEFRVRFEPAMTGLRLTIDGGSFAVDGTHPSGARRFLGWSDSRHWILPDISKLVDT